MQQHPHEHFCSSNHNCFISDVSITFIDKTDPSGCLQRKDYWRSTLKTMTPFGLNTEESVWRSLFLVPCCVALGAAMLEAKKFFWTSCWALSEFEHRYVLGLCLWKGIFISFNNIVIFIVSVIVIFITIIIIFMDITVNIIIITINVFTIVTNIVSIIIVIITLLLLSLLLALLSYYIYCRYYCSLSVNRFYFPYSFVSLFCSLLNCL